MTLFRTFLAIIWIVALATMIAAVGEMGPMAAVDFFFGDISHPWRGQFNLDFSGHLLLMAAWIYYREPSAVARPLCAMGAMLFGGAFSFAYILVATIRAEGDMRKLLLGRRG